jgi:hypothetical protein
MRDAVAGMTTALIWALLVLAYGASTTALIRQGWSRPARGSIVHMARRRRAVRRRIVLRGASSQAA